MKLDQLLTACLIAGTILFNADIIATSSDAYASEAESLHRRAWEESLDTSVSLPAASYGAYAYRSLAVQHPEVYLQADELISQTLEDLPGSRLAYRSSNVRDVELFLRMARRESKGGAFAWGMMTGMPDSVLDTKSPRSALEWAGFRSPSVAVLLKSVSSRLSTLESSLLRYAQLTRTRRNGDALFVVVDRGGVGYLASDSNLWEAGLSSRPVENWSDISPVLIFNRRAVYSALSGRDDRAGEPLLAALLDRLGSPAKMSFNSEGRELIARIALATSLPDSTSHRLAVLIASGLTDQRQPHVNAAWSEFAGGDLQTARCATLLLEEAYYWGNRLSSISAELATGISQRSLPEAMSYSQEQYIAWVGRRVSPGDSADLHLEAWGCLWSYDLLQTVIDDNIRTRAGTSASQASAMSAALDLAGVDHFQLAVRMGDKQIPDQHWLFAGNGRFQYNFGIWTEIPESHSRGSRPTTLLVTGFAVHGKNVRIGNEPFCSRIDDLAIGEHLSRITRQLTIVNLATTDPTGETMPLHAFLSELVGERFKSVSPVWPHSPSE